MPGLGRKRKRNWLIGASLLLPVASGSWPSGASTPAPTTLPQTGSMVAHWDASAITPQADNTNLTTWTDSINGYVATVPATAPKYRTGGMNGKAFVQSAGTAYMDCGTTTTLNSAITSGNYTIIVIAKNIGVKTNGMLFGANTTGTNGPYIYGNGSRVGSYQTSGGGTRSVPFTTGFAVIGDISYSGAFYGNSGIRRQFLNGTIFQEETNAFTSLNGNFGIFGRPTGSVPSAADIYNIMVWNVRLHPAELLQVMAWACEQYAQTKPWTLGSKFYTFSGDSLTVGQNATAPANSYPYLTAAALGLQFGQWTNLGVRGITMPQMTTIASNDLDPIFTLLNGSTHILSTFEWYNQSGTAPTPENNSRAYLAARKAALPTLKIAFGTSTDAAAGATNRANYNAAFDSPNDHTTNIDGYVPIHLNANIGVAGTNANTTYFAADNVHLTDTGYIELKNEFYSVVSTL